MSENAEKTDKKKEPVVFENVKVYIEDRGKTYEYFMTDDIDVLCGKLCELGYRQINVEDWRLNPNLDKQVREKMENLGCCFSMISRKDESSFVYYWGGAQHLSYMIYLDELLEDSSYFIKKQFLKLKSSVEFSRWSSNYDKNNTCSPLMIAVMANSIEFAKVCIADGEDVNFCDKDGFPPLFHAVAYKNTEMVDLLVKNGADVNFHTDKNFSIFSYACNINHNDSCTEIIKILKDAGAKTDNSGVVTRIPKKYLTFNSCLEYFIQISMLNGLEKPSQIYKNTSIGGEGGIDKRAFSKIRSQKNPNYHPKKNTVFLLALGMNLTVAQTEQLLFSAGYAFDEKNKFDMTIKDFIQKRNFRIEEIENALFEATGKYLGQKEDSEK